MNVNLPVILCAVVALFGCTEQPTRTPSASDNVTIIQPPFTMPELDRERTIRVYTPPDYGHTNKRYPVLYMHDGQNIFDEATSFAGEWQVDESLDELFKRTGFGLIVVAIDNGGDKRMNELSPWAHPDFGAAQGKEYMAFIVDVIKPYIDTHFRSLPDRQNTGIMGSSMGGLISHYGLHAYPQIFSKVGVFSPSFWFSNQVFKHTANNRVPEATKLWFLVGSKEGPDMVDNTEKMLLQMTAQGHPAKNLHYKAVKGAEHNESFWAGEFQQAVVWMFEASQ